MNKLRLWFLALAALATASGAPVMVKHQQETVHYAAAELRKYLGLMSGSSAALEAPSIQLGLFSDFDLPVPAPADPEADDAIYVDVRDSRGVIAGSNPRSVLFAVYRFLEANGCRWLRPGKGGDFVPPRDPRRLSAKISEKLFSRIG